MNLYDIYLKTRHASEEMCRPLKIEDYIPQAMLETSPPKWNLAHTTWFFEEFILTEFYEDYKLFHPMFSYLFNSYYNTVGDRTLRNERGFMSRPTVDEVYKYRAYVDRHMTELLLSKNLNKKLLDLVRLGINHEQQHQELFLTDIKYTFSLNPLYPEYRKEPLIEQHEILGKDFISVEGGVYEIGYEGEDFCFDNELGRHKVFLQDFSIRQSLVSNKEYIQFIEDGGYEDHNLWHAEAWAWLQENNIEMPLYWQKINDDYSYYTLGGFKKVADNFPVCHVNYYEAAAFAAYKELRLPTEFEWEAASALFNWGERWEWTESAYLPYPGYHKEEGAVGEYNGKFMVNQKVLRGASVATQKGHSRPSYRNFFHPVSRWQFTGIRLAK